MFNDEYQKFTTQVSTIDVMVKSIDEVLVFFKTNEDLFYTNKSEKNIMFLKTLLSKIFEYTQLVIETMPNVNDSAVDSSQLASIISIVNEYWNEQNIELFYINWMIFTAQWNDYSKAITASTNTFNLYDFSLN
jgi:hypothetical protein